MSLVFGNFVPLTLLGLECIFAKSCGFKSEAQLINKRERERERKRGREREREREMDETQTQIDGQAF